MRDPVLHEIVQRRGMVTRIARECGISTAAVSQWDRVPEARVEQVASIAGIPAEALRPTVAQATAA